MRSETTSTDCPQCGDEIEVNIEATYTPAERATHDYPGCDAEWEWFAEAEPCESCGYIPSDTEIQEIVGNYEPPTREDFAESDARYAAEYADEDTDQ